MNYVRNLGRICINYGSLFEGEEHVTIAETNVDFAKHANAKSRTVSLRFAGRWVVSSKC
ncbi:hypothetical protein KC19_N039500 [Ceratodon purpureus]|nr:hypothetical protein KC19_N039500 [Ceratodon purpureus]KAG0504352.1 hypothetical protein KC19_N039500 [Ceratodon purpureus]